MRFAGDTAVLKSASVRPLLRWAGSKRQHVPFLHQWWKAGNYTRYVEPFAGSAALFFAIEPPRSLLGDINRELIEAYQTIRQVPQAVYQRLNRLAIGEDAYYRVRAMRPKLAVARAARFIYLNRFCFNGLYRTNAAGAFNVPYGAPKTPNVPRLKHFCTCARLLRHTTLVAADFRSVLAKVRQGDFVYLDPPYAVSSRRVFTEYSKDHFSTTDIADLAGWLEEIDRRGAAFILSYADCRDARVAFNGWLARRFAVRHNVSGFSSARRRRYELCLSNIKAFRRG